ncbi:uncharacterized protein BO95DRAFT_499285 [Aspergillus brunneoviolaceus CBS 621.78]|uniref:Uncharacterized protein n=1 Tax=Aspergillus brunneoviolaceus CBS 621.78 TaxID=1450534 RepID=A0ACD1G5Y9_9EURO|nr:hypothetical protein BO95DRAFT_499285 [Aspergillus brunneoviolaceus CBS 621.78]RAH44635.1 hypothetical protein BO95DRAFT_499285 [Aspergillus brunneoviolaceus CBS 621.78]
MSNPTPTPIPAHTITTPSPPQTQPCTWPGLSAYSANWACAIKNNQRYLAGALGLPTTANLWDLIHTDTHLAPVLRNFISARGTWFGADGSLRPGQKQTCFHTLMKIVGDPTQHVHFIRPDTPPTWASCTARKKFTAYALLWWTMAVMRARPLLFPGTDLTPGAERVDAFEVFMAARLLNYVYHLQAHCGGLERQARPKKVVPAVDPVRSG